MADRPYFHATTYPPSGGEVISTETERREQTEAVSREASRRQMDYERALSGAPQQRQPTAPQIREPELPPAFTTRAAKLDSEIVGRGVPADREKVLNLGAARFAKLLELDREARGQQRVFGSRSDFTRWSSVEFSLARVGAHESSAVPPRTTAECVAGSGRDREAVRGILGFQDLWKSNAYPPAVRAVYAFRDRFESLMLGRSLLDRIGADERFHSPFFSGGSLRRVLLFRDWIQALRGPILSVSLRDPVWHLVAWQAGERTPAPEPRILTLEFFGARAPGPDALRFCEALMQGFALGFDGWAFWEHVGRLTRKASDLGELMRWRRTLATRYPRIERFHAELKRCFDKTVGFGAEAHRELDTKAHRRFIDGLVHDRLEQISFVAALAIDDALPDSMTARFQSWFLCEVAEAPERLAERIAEALNSAFPGAAFTAAIGEGINTL